MKPVFTVESLASLCLKSYFIMLFAQLQERSHKKKTTTTKKKHTNNRSRRLASRPLGIYNLTKAYTGHSLSWSVATFEYLTELMIILEVNWGITYEQTLRGPLTAGREKEGDLATAPLEFEYLHRKSRCEILIGGDDILVIMTPLPFALASTSRWLAEIWQLSRRAATGKLKAEF